VPQLLKVASAQVLELFATHIRKVAPTLAQTPEERTLVEMILKDLLSGQVSKTHFFHGVKIRPPMKSADSAYHQPMPKPKPKNGSPDIAMAFMRKCIESDHPELAAATIRHMLSVNATSSPKSQARAEAVLLPLVPLILAEAGVRAALPDALVRDLGQAAVRLCLDGLHTHGGNTSRSEISQILDVASWSGDLVVMREVYVWQSPFRHRQDTES
jgi:hypothetical protein